MNRTSTSRQILGGYALAGLTLALGWLVARKVGAVEPTGSDVGTMLQRIFNCLALAIVFQVTAGWGYRRGYVMQGEDGRIRYDHLLRVIVMTGIVWLLVRFGAGAVMAGLALAWR